ncbi:MAG: YbaB/EbfC family nucleoid-associated protein [Planctomycetota bacterium]
MTHDMNLLKQAQEMSRLVREVQRELAERVLEGSSGGGAVRCTITGQLEVRSIRIDPKVVDPEEVAMLEDLVTAAVRNAVKAALDLRKAKTDEVTGGILPDLGL